MNLPSNIRASSRNLPLFGVEDSTIEAKAVNALSACKFFPGSWDKSFVQDVANRIETKHNVTAKQRQWIWRIVWSYRRQIKDRSLVEHSIGFLGEDKEQAALLMLVEDCSNELADGDTDADVCSTEHGASD